ncbi:DUF7659 family protein [Paraclostridium bifermentans]|uniref:DUF7659 family protein n=1 Tax=Paraclostridium bifermentans TaxID=1490 RepID=UPI0025AF3F4E|nr:hypothetical protein [Paraclostridium bifermentans]
MNKYRELKEKQGKELNEFPMMFAFSNKQFAEGMAKLGLKENETNKLLSIGAGGFIRKSDRKAFDDMFVRQEKELKKAIAEDLTGEGFIYNMFNYELGNHEYCITWELDETLNTLGLTMEEINSNEKLSHGLKKAIENKGNVHGKH